MDDYLNNYRCEHCGHFFQTFEKVKIGDKCPNCHLTVGKITTTKPQKWIPGNNAAIFFTILAIILPVIPGGVCLYIALKGQERSVRTIAWVGVAISVLFLIVLIYALTR